jgi:iron complex outermembrane receptor protein
MTATRLLGQRMLAVTSGHADWTIANFDNGSLSFFPEAQYSDSYYYDIFNAETRQQDDYWLFNARLTYEHISGMSVSLWGKNLADEEYEPWGADTGDFGADYFVRGKPRMYGVEATYRF